MQCLPLGRAPAALDSEEMSRTHFLCLLQASEHKENCPQTCTAALSCIPIVAPA